MFVHHMWYELRSPKLAFQRKYLFPDPPLSLIKAVLVLRPSSFPERADVSQKGVYQT
jgi:hypothetical protein